MLPLAIQIAAAEREFITALLSFWERQRALQRDLADLESRPDEAARFAAAAAHADLKLQELSAQLEVLDAA